MIKSNKTTKEQVSRAIIKIKKRELIERLEEKSNIRELTETEKTILIETIYNNYNDLRNKLSKMNLLIIKQHREIEEISTLLLDAIYNALDKNDMDSIQTLVKQYNLYCEYFDIVVNNESRDVKKAKKNEIVSGKSKKR